MKRIFTRFNFALLVLLLPILRISSATAVPLDALPLPQDSLWHPDKILSDNAIIQHEAVAEIAVNSGTLLSSSTDSALMVRDLAVSKAGNQLQQWFNQFGSARIQLNTDEHFSLKNSQADLLLPLYQKNNNFFFTQTSLHRSNERSQANLGAGMRSFNYYGMLGGNFFVDYDISRDHARAGMGIEYWRDNIKFGFNQYLRLTNWKNSPDRADYEERPVNGWDLRAQGWHPGYPHLGASLQLEQYYGDEVALFGKDNTQKNPHSLTAGLNWTPIPLLTFIAEQRLGKAGLHDSRIALNLSYQLGSTWYSQTSPDAVAGMRTMAGSRYDLVERNNNIVLEHRRKNIIRLHSAKVVQGNAGEKKSLNVSVESKYDAPHITWTAPEFLAAGGQLVQEGKQYSVILPSWQDNGVNTYTISGIATDIKGNRSEPGKTQIRVKTPQPQTTFTALPASIVADNNTLTTITFKPVDDQGELISGIKSEIAFNISDNTGSPPDSETIYMSSITESSPGVYTATLKGNSSGQYIITPHYRGETLDSRSISIELTPKYIDPFSYHMNTSNGPVGIVPKGKSYIVSLVATIGKTERIIPVREWETTAVALKMISAYGNEIIDSNPIIENDSYVFSAKDADYKFENIDIKIKLNNKTQADKLFLRITKIATHWSVDNELIFTYR